MLQRKSDEKVFEKVLKKTFQKVLKKCSKVAEKVLKQCFWNSWSRQRYKKEIIYLKFLYIFEFQLYFSTNSTYFCCCFLLNHKTVVNIVLAGANVNLTKLVGFGCMKCDCSQPQ